MASEPDYFVTRENNKQQQLSVAVSYEAELMVPNDRPSRDDGQEGVTTGTEHGPKEQVRGSTAADTSESTDLSLPNEQTTQDADESVLPSSKCLKRRADTLPPSLATKKSRLDDIGWEDLVSHVQDRLGSMDTDECFSKSLQIAAVARQQVQTRSLHLLNAFDMLGKGNQGAAVPSPTAASIIYDPLEQWMQKYLELKLFHQMHGHFDVPLDQSSYEALGKWVIDLKANASSLNSTQMHMLSRIGFPLDGTLSVKLARSEASDLPGQEHPPIETPRPATQDMPPYPQPAQTQLDKPETKGKGKFHQEKLGVVTQKQIKMHRTNRFRTLEAVPCIKMAPPLPPKADCNPALTEITVPVFQSLCNFPSARFVNCCVMCDESEYPIPNQNKGVCNNCDSAVWIYVETGLQIKWCKGCKNFRKWIDFGPKVRQCKGIYDSRESLDDYALMKLLLFILHRDTPRSVKTAANYKLNDMHWQRTRKVLRWIRNPQLLKTLCRNPSPRILDRMI